MIEEIVIRDGVKYAVETIGKHSRWIYLGEVENEATPEPSDEVLDDEPISSKAKRKKRRISEEK